MRKKIVAGNWKMNLNEQEAIHLATEIKKTVSSGSTVPEVILFPPLLYLTQVRDLLTGSAVQFGAQDCSQFNNGAYTGEVSASMLHSAGVPYVLVGHSERRSIFHEDDKCIQQKLKLALAQGLTPVLCCGEPLSIREDGTHTIFVEAQLNHAMDGLELSEISRIIIAYEPVWAIGTGRNASPEQAQDMHAFIRTYLSGRAGAECAQSIPILYGGSCKPANAAELFRQPDVDGGLIGGASLNASDFLAIIRAI